MNQSRLHPFVFSLLINVVLFSAILAFGFPIFNSGDDVYLIYLLGGGFGQQPTELLHYHYAVHPYMGLVLKNLFVQFPNFNWYTALLLLFHFLACVVLLWQLIKRNNLTVAVLSFALIFFTLEARFVLQPSFTNTALVTALSGVLIFYDALRKYSITKIIVVYGLILAASMFRMHLLIPVIIIAAPFFLVNIKKTNIRTIAFHGVGLSVLVTISIFLQQQYYKKHIPDWSAEETYRSAVIQYYNIPKKQISSWSDSTQLAADLVEQGMLWDKTLLSHQKIAAVTSNIKLTHAAQRADFKERIYWLMMENRAAVLLLLLFLFYRFPFMNRKEKLATIGSAFLMLAMCMGLLLFRKLPPYIIPACVLVWLAFAGVTGSSQKIIPSKRNWIFAIIGMLLLAWSVARLYKLNKWNKTQNREFTCAYKYVAGSRDKLFIVTDDKFPMDFFHVWNTPRQYPLPNLLYKDHFLNNTFQPAYQKFGINTPQQFLNNDAVVIIGQNPSLACKYYEWKNRTLVGAKQLQNTPPCVQSFHLIKDTVNKSIKF